MSGSGVASDVPTLASLRAALAGRTDVVIALLFGSRARGSHRPDSDVDVAVLGPVDRLALALELTRATERDVQVVDLATANHVLLSEIVREGIAVHEGVPGALGNWRSHAMTQLDLDRPFVERMQKAYLAKLASGAHR